MDFSFNRNSVQDLARKARETARNAVQTAKTGVEKAGAKVDLARETMRLERACRDLAEEINVQMTAIGELVYATHKGSPSDSEDIEEILRFVDGLYEEMDGHRAELRKLKGSLICPNCGAENAPESFYCQECGKPFNVETI